MRVGTAGAPSLRSGLSGYAVGMTARTADRLAPFGVTIFAEMSRLAAEHGAVNLSQGFPDFDGPEFVKRAHSEAVAAGHNQYAPMGGVPALQQAIADWHAAGWVGGAPAVDPAACITVTSGCTEAIAATMLGQFARVINPRCGRFPTPTGRPSASCSPDAVSS